MVLSIRRSRALAVGVGAVAPVLVLWYVAHSRAPVPADFETDAGLSRIDRLEARKDAKGLAAAVRDPSPEVAGRAVMALASIQGKAARGAMEQAMADPRPQVRQAAAQQLGSVGERGQVQALRAALREDTSGAVRAAAARSLGRLLAWDGTEELLSALDDPDVLVRASAIEALQNITGMEFRFKFDPNAPAYARQAAAADVRRLVPGVHDLYVDYLKRMEKEQGVGKK